MEMKSLISLALTALLFSSNLFAAIDSMHIPPFRFMAEVSAGPSWKSGTNSQTKWLTPAIEKTYTQNGASSTFFNGQLFLGILYPIHNQIESETGLAFVSADHASITGEIWDEADSQFNNYTYDYSVQHAHLAIKQKILFHNDWVVVPWLSGSIGIGWNRSYEFQNTPTIPEAIVTPNFSSHTKTAFVYTLGVGVQRAIDEHWNLAAGFEFSDWGNYALGRSSSQSIGSGPGGSHLYTQSVLLSAAYIA